MDRNLWGGYNLSHNSVLRPREQPGPDTGTGGCPQGPGRQRWPLCSGSPLLKIGGQDDSEETRGPVCHGEEYRGTRSEMMPSCAAHQAGHPVILGLSVKMGFYPLLLPLTPTWWLEEHRRVWISQERERERERKREREGEILLPRLLERDNLCIQCNMTAAGVLTSL